MNVYIGWPIVVSDMQWPCSDWFHIPLYEEWNAIYNAWVNLWAWTSSWGNNFSTYLKLPMAGERNYNKTAIYVGSLGGYWASTPYGNNEMAVFNRIVSGGISPRSVVEPTYGLPIRWIKNSPIIPTSSWTKLYWTSIESWWIFHNQTDWLISISSDGSTWYTIMDKNLWATQVWNNWDTLTDLNCGNVFQWWNNYAFPWTLSSESITSSSAQIDATWYWPWNYYKSSTWIAASTSQSSSTYNKNLRWWVTQWTTTDNRELKNAYIGEVYEYSYDFRNKTLASVLSDWWTVSEWSFDSSFWSNWLHWGTSWNVLTKNTNEKLSNTSIIDIETNVNITSTTYWQTNVWLIMGGTNEIFLSIYYNGSQDWYRLGIDWTNYWQYVSHSAWNVKMICKIDLWNKTYNATIWSTNITWSLSSTQVNNLINKTLSIKCVAKDEYVWDVKLTIC